MKFKILVFSISFLFISQILSAKTVIDSIGVKNQNGKKVILFKIKAKDTYYSIGHRYNVKPDVIMKFNGSKKQTLSIGATVNVPTDEPYKAPHKKEKEKPTEQVAKETKKEKKVRLAAEAKAAEKEKTAEPVKETKKEKRARLADEAKAAKEEKRRQQEEEKQAAAQAEVKRNETARIAQQVVTEKPAQKPQPPVDNDDLPTMQYKVSAGETLYGISKRFNTSVDDISKLNNLSSTSLAAGALILVRQNSLEPRSTPATTSPAKAAPMLVRSTMPIAKRDSTAMAHPKDSSVSERRVNGSRFGLYEKTEKGVGTWMDDNTLDASKKLVLHRTAPIGTVVKITNPMSNRTTYAKVVGRFTDSEATKDVIVVMTKNVAESLGALDKRFHVIITYGSPNE